MINATSAKIFRNTRSANDGVPCGVAQRLDSERLEPFVNISGLFAAKCPQ
jgi:hypothetical protein